MADEKLHPEVESMVSDVGYDLGSGVAARVRGIALLAAEKAREEQREVDAKIAKSATLPGHFHWGEDAMESFDFGKECAAAAIRRGKP